MLNMSKIRVYKYQKGVTFLAHSVCAVCIAVYAVLCYAWLQVQRGEESQINIMGNVNQPFLATGRYDVFFISTPPTFKLQLHVTGQRRRFVVLLSIPSLLSLNVLCLFVFYPEPHLNPIRNYSVKMRGPHINFLTLTYKNLPGIQRHNYTQFCWYYLIWDTAFWIPKLI